MGEPNGDDAWPAMSGEARILVLDESGGVTALLRSALARDAPVLVRVDDPADAGRLLGRGVDLLIVNVCTASGELTRLASATNGANGVPVLVLTGCTPMTAAAELLFPRAQAVVQVPVPAATLRERVAAALSAGANGGSTGSGYGDIVGVAPAMQRVYRRIRQVADTGATVLVSGETGTGKELVAKTIHEASSRRAEPFVVINCAELAETLLESELFGHVRGAFTGATRDRVGLFEAADGGTVLLDEIGDVGPGLQARLLRVLQEREVRRIGAVRSRPVDIRIIAATQRDLEKEVEAGRFRRDLYHRLKVFSIALPPLRDRVEDLPLLVEHGLARMEPAAGSPRRCSDLVLELLATHDWPGNVRELFAVLESAAIVARGPVIGVLDLPDDLRAAFQLSLPAGEADAITRALTETGGNRRQAAAVLGISRTTLWRRMRELGLLD